MRRAGSTRASHRQRKTPATINLTLFRSVRFFVFCASAFAPADAALMVNPRCPRIGGALCCAG
jgi:hypothetical protein